MWVKVKIDPGRGTTASGGAHKLSQNFSNLCDSVCSLKFINLPKRALPHSVNTTPLAPPQSGMELLPTRVIAARHSPATPATNKPLKPLCQFLSA